MNFKDLKPKGLERHKVKWQTKFDSKLRTDAVKPEITFSWGDRFNQFAMWFQGFAVDAFTGIVRRIIPGYVWLALVAILVIIALVVLL